MKKFAKYVLALAVAGGLSTSTLGAQEYYDYNDACCAPSCDPCAPECGTECATGCGWLGWVAAGAAIAGIVVIAVTHSNNSAHNDS